MIIRVMWKNTKEYELAIVCTTFLLIANENIKKKVRRILKIFA